MMYAKQLLEDRDPVHVVATLLDLATPEAPCAPMKVVGFDPKTERGAGRPDRAPRDRKPAASRDSAEFTRFFVSWGEESGATAGRLLSQVCRRGGIESHQVGAIEVAARVSFVSVSNEVAQAFEKQAQRPDKRDPGIIIKRADDKKAARPAPAGYAPHGAPSGARAEGGGARGRYADRAQGAGRPAGPHGPRRPSGGPPSGPAGSKGGATPPAGPGHRPRAHDAKGPKRTGSFKPRKPGHKPGR